MSVEVRGLTDAHAHIVSARFDQDRDRERWQERMTRLERTLDPAVDRAYWRKFLLHYAATPVEQHEPQFDAWFGIEGNQVDEAALDAKLDEMYAGTQLHLTDERLPWLCLSDQLPRYRSTPSAGDLADP